MARESGEIQAIIRKLTTEDRFSLRKREYLKEIFVKRVIAAGKRRYSIDRHISVADIGVFDRLANFVRVGGIFSIGVLGSVK